MIGRSAGGVVRGRETGRPALVGVGAGGVASCAPAAVDQRQRRDVLLDAVLKNLEVVPGQVGDELILVIARDHVGGDEVDRDSERWLRPGCLGHGRCLWCRGCLGCRGCLRCRTEGGGQCDHGDSSQPNGVAFMLKV